MTSDSIERRYRFYTRTRSFIQSVHQEISNKLKNHINREERNLRRLKAMLLGITVYWLIVYIA